MEQVRKDKSKAVMTTYLNEIRNPMLFVNMDETNIEFNCKPTQTVHRRGEKTISIRIGGSTSLRATLCVSIAMDGTKLPLFIIFKGQSGGRIARDLHNILPAGVHGCVQKKSMDG